MGRWLDMLFGFLSEAETRSRYLDQARTQRRYAAEARTEEERRWHLRSAVDAESAAVWMD